MDRREHSPPTRSSRADAPGVLDDEIERAARALVAAYGPGAIALMQRRTRAVRRRGDEESATLWRALARAVEMQIAAAPAGRVAGTG
jgi:hypothetical protein